MARTPAATTFRQWLERLPKVELHVHLEGAIPYDALWALICKYGGDPHVPDPPALRQRLQYRDFPHFIETWVWKNEFVHASWLPTSRKRALVAEFESAPDWGLDIG